MTCACKFAFAWLALSSAAFAAPRTVELELQTRDPKTGEISIGREKVDPTKVGLVIVDLWNYHWCMTWSHQTGSALPRFNEAARVARKLGMQVLWAPSDVANARLGWPQRERALAVPYCEVPQGPDVGIRFTVRGGPCHCGPGIACCANWGHDDMADTVDIAEQDLIVAGTQETYSNCKALGLTHLIYAGGATNICLTGKPAGLRPMARAGLKCLIARDLSEAWTHYDPAAGHTPQAGNAQAVADVERAGIASIHLEQWAQKLGLWDDDAVVHELRFTPWGKRDRPYLFEESVTVTLTTPAWLEKGDIHYTVDGSHPSSKSAKYTGPLVLSKTTELRAAASSDGRRVSLFGGAYYVRLPRPPPKPHVYLDSLEMLPDPYGRHGGALNGCLWHPVVNRSYEDRSLRVRGTSHERGLGMRAPANARYALKPQYDRFVALAGVDDNMLGYNVGRNIAMHPSVVFKVFIDGHLAAESPVMRISSEPWRFDVKIPQGSRQMNLVATDGGSRSAYDLGNWVRAGFVPKTSDN